MQASERFEFKTELVKLCAGFEVPCTKAREEAYWSALSKMSIAQFRRCVEHALGPDYERTGFPKTGDIWRIHKGKAPAERSQSAPDDPDHLSYFANRLLWMHLSHRGGMGSTSRFVPARGVVECQTAPELDRCVAFKRELVTEFCRYITEGDEMATPQAFIRWWLAGLEKISEVLPRTRRDLEHLAEQSESQIQFATSMARELHPKETTHAQA